MGEGQYNVEMWITDKTFVGFDLLESQRSIHFLFSLDLFSIKGNTI